MRCSRSRRRAPAVVLFIFAFPAVLGGGCRSGDDPPSRMDEASRARLDALPAEARVLASGRLASPADTLPSFGVDARVLGLTPGAVLVELPRADLARLGAVAGRIAVWGDDSASTKLEPRLRTRLLAAWTAGDPAPLPMIATFRDGDAGDVRPVLEAAGATVRTVAGPVVTLDAPPEAVFRLLALPGLARLQQPRPLKLLDESQP